MRSVGDKTERWISKAKARVRKAATRTLIVIVFEYLFCNVLGIFLSAWEHFHYQSLAAMPRFYTHASDITSLLSVFSCAIRLPTYWLCDVTFRKELRWAFCHRRHRQTRKSRSYSQASMGRVVAALINDKEGGHAIAGTSSSSNSAYSAILQAAYADHNHSDRFFQPAPSSSRPVQPAPSSSRPVQPAPSSSRAVKQPRALPEEADGGFRSLAARALAFQRAQEEAGLAEEEESAESRPRTVERSGGWGNWRRRLSRFRRPPQPHHLPNPKPAFAQLL